MVRKIKGRLQALIWADTPYNNLTKNGELNVCVQVCGNSAIVGILKLHLNKKSSWRERDFFRFSAKSSILQGNQKEVDVIFVVAGKIHHEMQVVRS